MVATIKENTNRNEPMSYLGRDKLIAEYARKRHSGLINDYEIDYCTGQFVNESWTTDTEDQTVIPIPPNVYDPSCFSNDIISNVHTLEICSCRSIYTDNITLGGSSPTDFNDLPIYNLGFNNTNNDAYGFLCAIASNGTLFVRFPNGKQYKDGSDVIGDPQGTYAGTTNITTSDMWIAENITQSEWYTSGKEYTSVFCTIAIVVSDNLISFYCNGKRKQTFENSGAGNGSLTLYNQYSNDMMYGFDGEYGAYDEPGSMACAIRLYNDVLTDDEIANNALQDRLLYL